MFGNTEGHRKWTRRSQLGILLASASVLLVMAFAGSQVLAGRLADTLQTRSGGAMTGSLSGPAQAAIAPNATDHARPPSDPNAIDAFLVMVPDTVTLGSCAAPANGGTVAAGCRFVLDMFVNAGTNMAPDGLTAAQAYMTFTYQTIQNARVSTIATSCVLTGTITADISVFDAPLQNEVCNGPAQCNFRGTIVDPGSFSFAAGALQNCPNGCPDPGGGPPFDQNPFRIAQIGVCAISPGQAGFFWQFANSAPNDRCQNGAPATRDTELVTINSELVQDCTRFANYTFTVTGPTSTVTSTPTQGGGTSTLTPTVTNTAVASTLTPTRTNTAVANTLTPTSTNTAVANTLTPTRTNTTVGNTLTPTSTNTTVGNTLTPTVTNTAIASTLTPTRTNTTVANTLTPTSTNTTVGNTLTPTVTNTAVANTLTPTRTNTAVANTLTPTSTNTAVANTLTPTRTNTTVGNTATSTNTPSMTNTVIAGTATNTFTPGNTNTPVDTNTPINTPTNTRIACGPGSNYLYMTGTTTIVTSTNMFDIGNHTDDGTTAITLPFAFNLYAQTFTTANVSSNGNMQFVSSATDFTNVCLPTAIMDFALFPYWDDLDTNAAYGNCMTLYSTGCGVFTSVTGTTPSQIFSIEWRTVRHDLIGGPKAANFEIQLYEGSNRFDFIYGQVDDGGAQATIGVQRASTDANYFTQYACNTANSVSSGMMIRFALAECSTPTPTRTPCLINFSDVHPSDYFYVAVRYLYCAGAISGYNDNTFRPYDITTRGQLAKIVVLGVGLPIDTSNGPHFEDVPAGNVFYTFIETAYNGGIVGGYTCVNGTDEPCVPPGNRPYYRPSTPVTRGQLTKIIVAAMRWPLDTSGGPHFADVPNTVPNVFYSFIETAYHRGVISGYDCGGPGEDCDPQSRPYFRPADSTVRGQIAKVVYLAILNP